MTFEPGDEIPLQRMELSNGFRVVVYPLDEDGVVRMSVTDEKGASFGLEMTSIEALETATMLQKAVGLEPPGAAFAER